MIYAASYCRVSTDKSDQANSYEVQQEYFREYISKMPNTKLFKIYADEGISGTTTKRRVAFHNMIADAKDGKFQLILTKEVSRFSRNILDTVRYTRELKSIGVGVLFLTDGINTLDPDSELRLTIMASIAQEESRRTSCRVVWGQTRQMERGIVFGHSLLGYDVKDGAMIINEDGALLVRKIFRLYTTEQYSAAQIAQHLTAKNIKTPSGREKWSSNTIIKILKNEKYIGDLFQKKTYTPDYLTHEKRPNQGQVPHVIIRNHHTPIIDRQLWEEAQKKLSDSNKRRKDGSAKSNLLPFSGKIICGECGSTFVCRTRHLSNGENYRFWQCGKAVRNGRAACNVGKYLREDDAIQLTRTALQCIADNNNFVISEVEDIISLAYSDAEDLRKKEITQIECKRRLFQKKRLMVLDQYLTGSISKDEAQQLRMYYDECMEMLSQKQAALPPFNAPGKPDREDIAQAIQKATSLEEHDLPVRMLVNKITVYRDRHVALRFNGCTSVFEFCEQ